MPSLCVTEQLIAILFTTTLNKVGEVAVGGGLTFHSLQQPKQ